MIFEVEVGKNYCPECGNRLKHYKCHVCGLNLGWGKKLVKVGNSNKKWKYAEK